MIVVGTCIQIYILVMYFRGILEGKLEWQNFLHIVVMYFSGILEGK